MKKKAPKFLIAKNEAAQPGVTFIVHTQEPPFVGEIHSFESLVERNSFVNESEREIIQITPTTVLVIVNYFNTSIKIKDRKYLESKIVHWVIANYLNSSAF